MNSKEDILAHEAKQLAVMEQLLSDIEQSREVNVDNTIQVYAPPPRATTNEMNLIAEKQSSIFTKQAKVIQKILQHPNCPENLSLEIMLTTTTNRVYYERTRAPLIPIFKALTSGKCTARGLKIELVGAANELSSNEMDILVRGLKEGKAPNNLQITLGSLLFINHDGQITYNIRALMDALKSPNCSSGLKIKYTEYEGQFCEIKQKYDELARLCTNGNYDRENIKSNIDKIYAAINKEISMELLRLGGRDTARMTALATLQSNIREICKKAQEDVKTCDPNNTWEWKTSLRTNLETEIKTALDSSKFDKKYTSLEKFGRNLLNLITGILFPLAIIKYATNGNAFYSTVGKSREAVDNTLNIISKTIK